MNEANELIEKLKQYYKVATSQELAEKIGVAKTTVSGWKQRNSINAVRRKIYELGLEIDVDNKTPHNNKKLENEYLIDQAIFTAKRGLQNIFDGNLIDTYWNKPAKDILTEVISRIDKDDETYTVDNSKNRLIDKIEEAEVYWFKNPLKASRKKLLSTLLRKYFSKVEVYVMIKYSDEVFDYVGYLGNSKKPKNNLQE